MNTEATSTITAGGDGRESQYDIHAKRILSNKNIMAHILCDAVDEFKGMKPEDIVSLIEGEPIIGGVPVDGGLTNIRTDDLKKNGDRIVGLNTENSDINEGVVRYDILFYVRMRDGLSRIIVNVEAQKDPATDYFILNRAIYYESRLISSQKEREFSGMNYNDIKVTYSIFICMNMKKDSINHYHLTNDKVTGNAEWKGNIGLFNIVIIGIKNDITDSMYKSIELLDILFSNSLTASERLDIMEKKFNIPLTDDLEGGVNYMSNLGEGIREAAFKDGEARGEARGKAMLIREMHNNNISCEEIARMTNIDLEDVKKAVYGSEPVTV